MNRIPVGSQALASVGYDASRSLLEVEFSSGALYRYHGVPAKVHRALMEADSHGHYFAERIRDRYRYERLIDSGQRSSV